MIYIRRVVGTSMIPALKPGQLVVAVRGRTYRPGEIVICKIGQREVIKRISGYTPDGIILRGDNHHASTDSRDFGPVDRSQIVGKLVYSPAKND